jgi:hypothetical protein
VPNSGTDSLTQEDNWVKGMWVTITDGVNSETNQIASVDSATQLTMTTNLAHTYATGSVTGLNSQKYGILLYADTGGAVDSNSVIGNTIYGHTTAPMDTSLDANVQIGLNVTS